MLPHLANENSSWTKPALATARRSRLSSVARIERLSEGNAFSAKDCLDIARQTMIEVTLASLTLSGKIHRVRRGLCDRPRVNPALGGKWRLMVPCG